MDEAGALKRLAAGIIREQGNRFIKELLRGKATIGTNKDDFERHLNEAIESGAITLADVEKWLAAVEGWGNQHVYLFTISSTLRKAITQPKILANIKAAKLEKLWNAPTMLAFPEVPTLTSISFNDLVLRLVWQEASPGWQAVPEKNYQQVEGLDLYEYRAFRRIESRALNRFEAHLPLGLAAMFIADPIEGAEHTLAVAEIKRVLDLLLPLPLLEKGQLDIGIVSRNLDQRNVPTNQNKTPPVKTQKSRLGSGGAYVEFGANSSDRGYSEETAILEVRRAVRAQELPAFLGSNGAFIFQPNDHLTRALRVELSGRDHRIRFRKEMDAREVWAILRMLSEYA